MSMWIHQRRRGGGGRGGIRAPSRGREGNFTLRLAAPVAVKVLTQRGGGCQTFLRPTPPRPASNAPLQAPQRCYPVTPLPAGVDICSLACGRRRGTGMRVC